MGQKVVDGLRIGPGIIRSHRYGMQDDGPCGAGAQERQKLDPDVLEEGTKGFVPSKADEKKGEGNDKNDFPEEDPDETQ